MAWDSFNSIQDFGYRFNEEGRLVMVDDEKAGFNFYVSDHHSYNQKNYEKLGEVITEYVYELLQSEAVGLKKFEIPVTKESSLLPNIKKQKNKGGAKGFIFVSKDFHLKDKLLILVHGSGVVRAGQWARRLIINDCLDHGTQIPYIKRAIKDGYGVVVTNTNQNDAYVDVKGKKVWKQIKESESPEKHFSYVWKNIIEKTSASKIFVVAHSYGGYLVVDYVSRFPKILQRVVAVAFTDSVHSLSRFHSKNDARKWFLKNSVNWVTSDQVLGTPMLHQDDEEHVTRVSAGTTKHEETSWNAIEAVFKYFQIQESEFDNVKEYSKKESGKNTSNKKGDPGGISGHENVAGGGDPGDISGHENLAGEGEPRDISGHQNVAGEDEPGDSSGHENVAGEGDPGDMSGHQNVAGEDEPGDSSGHENVAGEGDPGDMSGHQNVAGEGEPRDISGHQKVASECEPRDISGHQNVAGEGDPRDISGHQNGAGEGDPGDSSSHKHVAGEGDPRDKSVQDATTNKGNCEGTSKDKPAGNSGQQGARSGDNLDDSSDQQVAGVTDREKKNIDDMKEHCQGSWVNLGKSELNHHDRQETSQNDEATHKEPKKVIISSTIIQSSGQMK